MPEQEGKEREKFEEWFKKRVIHGDPLTYERIKSWSMSTWLERAKEGEEEVDKWKDAVQKFKGWLLEEADIEDIPDEIYFPILKLLKESK